MPEGIEDTEYVKTTRLIERAVRQRWPITDKMREMVIKRQYQIAISPNSTPREATSAAKTIVSADRLNLEEEQPVVPENHLHLHQHDYSKIPTAELERIERELLALSTGDTSGTAQAEPVPIRQSSVAADRVE